MAETWLMNERPTTTLAETPVSFLSHGLSFISIKATLTPSPFGTIIATSYRNAITGWVSVVTPDGAWVHQEYRLLEFEEAPTGNLLTWLQANAVKQSSITDLTGYTWEGNSTIDLSYTFTYQLSFTSGPPFPAPTNYYTISVETSGPENRLYYDNDLAKSSMGPWSPFKDTIEITGGTDATNAELIAWLEANGTLTREEPSSYEISTSLTGVTADPNNPTSIEPGETVTMSFTADEGYQMPDSITVEGATALWMPSTGTLQLSDPTDDVTVVIEGLLPQLDAPTGMAAEGTTISFNAVDNAEVYEIFADGVSIGEYVPEPEVYWDTPTISLDGSMLSTEAVEGVTKYKLYDNDSYVGYIDADNVWHGEVE